MDTIIAFVKRLRLSRILVVFLAGIVLFVNTACSQPSSVKTSKITNDRTSSAPGYNRGNQSSPGYNQKDNAVLKSLKESYKTEPRQGGMNDHRNVDRRLNTTASDAKAQELVNRAQGNLQKSVRNPKEAADNLRNDVSVGKIKQKFGDLSENVSESSQNIKEGAERGFKNLKSNLKSTADRVSDNVQ